MGTNYYLYEDVCVSCGNENNKLHIGKSSMGWVFLVRTHPEERIYSLDDWEKRILRNQKNVIKDEYGRDVTFQELMVIITERGRDKRPAPMGYDSWEKFHKANHSVDGPNNLLRHKEYGHFAVKHGPGTWDLIDQEFS